jgi:hypothetical protein
MNNGKHTPGPWIFSHDLGNGYSIAREVDGHNSASGKLLPVALAVFTAGNYNETENRAVASANAHLIAAAPELLEACRWVKQEIEWKHDMTASLTVLDRIIAKAEGR